MGVAELDFPRMSSEPSKGLKNRSTPATTYADIMPAFRSRIGMEPSRRAK